MRAVLLEAPQAMLDERRRLGLDRRDEMWDGELHVVPPAGGPHQRFGTRVLGVLIPVADRSGLVPSYETGLFAAADDYRVPDQLYSRPEHVSERGAEGAELVLEIRSPGDESYAKLEFYARLGVREVVIAHPETRHVELFRLVDDRLLPVTTGGDGAVRSDVLGVSFRATDGRLLITWEDGSAEV